MDSTIPATRRFNSLQLRRVCHFVFVFFGETDRATVAVLGRGPGGASAPSFFVQPPLPQFFNRLLIVAHLPLGARGPGPPECFV